MNFSNGEIVNKYKVMPDTSTWVSYFGDRTRTFEREDLARKIITRCHECENLQLVYCSIIIHELSQLDTKERNEQIAKMRQIAVEIGTHTGTATWGQLDHVTWDQWASPWGDDDEHILGTDLQNQLPDTMRRNNLRDRNLIITANREGVSFFIHENPKDFNNIEQSTIDGLVMIDLLRLNTIDEFDTIISISIS